MDQSTLVEDQINDGRRFVERFAADGNRVQAAFWVKTAEEGLWFLYLATDLVDREGPTGAYRAVYDSLRKLGDSWVRSSEIKVISPSNPIAQDVLAHLNRHPGRLAARFDGGMLGSMAIEKVYVYPAHFYTFAQPNPMTTEDLGRQVVRLMNRGPGALQPSRVALKDGTSFDGVPCSLQFGSQNSLVIQFVADGEAALRVYRMDEISAIL